MKFQKGAENPRYRGGEWTNSSGYPMVWVGKDHPCARCRAYAPKHLLVFWQTHGRLPLPGHHIHHVDEDKANADPSNLEERLGVEHNREHGRKRLTSERAREIGARGGRNSMVGRMKAKERFAASQRALERMRQLASRQSA